MLQARGGWQFDVRSAMIGAALAWIIAAILYGQRRALGDALRKAWAPIAAWRRRARASQEEKYLRALEEQLKPLLLGGPADLGAVFIPPALQAMAPLPVSFAEATTAPRTMTISYAAMLSGHPRLVLCGTQGSGRTTTMIMLVSQAFQDRQRTGKRAQKRLPIWIDLTATPGPTRKKPLSAADNIVAAASAFLPAALPQWISQRLRRDPCLLLLDNWEMLTPDRRAQVACWIAEADGEFRDAFWIVASAPEGYSDLAQTGFVPVEIVSQGGDQWRPGLYAAWQASLGRDVALPDEETLAALARAAKAGALPWELHVRTLVHLETGELPARPIEAIDRYVAHRIDSVSLGKLPEPIPDTAEQIALDMLMAVAARTRVDGQPALTNKEMRELLATQLAAQPQRNRRLDEASEKLLTGSGLLQQTGRTWRIVHPILADYFAACHLVRQETGSTMIEAHLDDPTWYQLTEFYAGMADVTPLAEGLIGRTEIDGDSTFLLRVARWSIATDPQAPHHKTLLKMLARSFMVDSLSPEIRGDIGRAIALSAGEGARAFFVQMLRNPAPTIRGAALLGLGWSKASSDLVILVSALRDENAPEEVRQDAVRALLELGSDEALSALASALPDVDQALMQPIAEALAADPRGGEALQEASNHPDLFVRRAATFGLGRIDTDWARERLLEIAREDQEWMVRSAAELALQAADDLDQKHASIAAPPQPDQLEWLIGWAARQGEGLGVGEAALAMLRRAAQEGNADARVLSALTLAQIGRESEISALEPLMGHLDPQVAQTAAWAVSQIRKRHRIFQAA